MVWQVVFPSWWILVSDMCCVSISAQAMQAYIGQLLGDF